VWHCLQKTNSYSTLVSIPQTFARGMCSMDISCSTWHAEDFTLSLCSQMQSKHSGTRNCERALAVALQSCALLPQCTCTGCCRVEQLHETVQLLQRLLVYQWSRIPKLLYRVNYPLITWLPSNHAWFELKSVQAEPLSCKNPRPLTYSGLAWLCELSGFNIQMFFGLLAIKNF